MELTERTRHPVRGYIIEVFCYTAKLTWQVGRWVQEAYWCVGTNAQDPLFDALQVLRTENASMPGDYLTLSLSLPTFKPNYVQQIGDVLRRLGRTQ